MGNLAQLWDAIDVGIQVQNVLAVVALAGLDEVEVVFLELPNFHDMILGALELCGVSLLPEHVVHQDALSYAPA